MDVTRHIEVYRALREELPIHIGGSFALMLLGYDLGRPIHDLDLIIPEYINEYNYTQIKEKLQSLNPNENYETGASMDQFEIGYATFDQHNQGELRVDIAYNPSMTAFTDVIYKEQIFRVTSLAYIIRAKMEYAQNRYAHSQEKHYRDLYKLEAQGCPEVDTLSLPTPTINSSSRRTSRGGTRTSNSSSPFAFEFIQPGPYSNSR